MMRLSEADLREGLEALPSWSVQGGKLRRRVEFESFGDALGFIVRVGLAAERLGHHPEIHNVYGVVELASCTHDAGGALTSRDLALARAIEALL